jgi:hypothetical protein
MWPWIAVEGAPQIAAGIKFIVLKVGYTVGALAPRMVLMLEGVDYRAT